MKHLLIIVVALFIQCTPVDKATLATELDDVSQTVREVCINSHIYYLGWGVRMNDNGFPVKCKKILRKRRR